MHQALPDVVHAPRTDPIYNCHAYLTKVPVGAIQPFIEAFTRPGDTVADPFAGSGMTGIAAFMLGRRAELSDISALGRHIATGYVTQVDASAFRKAASEVIEHARKAIGALYTTRRKKDGAMVEVVRTVWSFVYVCPNCRAPLVYYEALRDGDGKIPEECPKCPSTFARRSWLRLEDVPVCVVVEDAHGRQIEQPIGATDLDAIRVATEDPRHSQIPSREIEPSREMFSRSGLGKTGMVETRNFFSPRNAIALLELWRAIRTVSDMRLRKKLLFSFTATLARASKRYQWGPKRPLNAQNQTYYIAPIYYEWNVFDLFRRKIESACRSDELVTQSDLPLLGRKPSVPFRYETASADTLSHLADASVDYVFTDPPFGSNIFYSDMNLFQEAWLGELTDETREAVIHTTGKRKSDAADRYQTILEGAFKEVFRILRPGKYMSVVFGNSSGSIWSLVQRALRNAGFDAVPAHVGILDKGQRSVKGLNSGSEGVVTLDLILTVQKPRGASTDRSAPTTRKIDVTELLRAAVDALGVERRRNPSYLYVAAIREAIRRHLPVEDLHHADVLIALRNAGCEIDSKTGLLARAVTARMFDQSARAANS